MNLFQLVFKQMRQRALATWLTLLSVVIGVALAVAIVILQRESAALFGQSDFGYDLIIGPPRGSPLQLTLNTVYHMDVSQGNIPYALYQDLSRTTAAVPEKGEKDFRAYVKWAVPFMVGDSYNGRRLVGTSPLMFGVTDDGKPVSGEAFEYRKGKRYEFAEGRAFAPRKFEAVIGSDTAEKEHFKIGSTFRATHNFPGPNDTPDIHKPIWTVVGILKPTHTANDRVLFIPVISLYAIEEHDIGLITQLMIRNNFDPNKSGREKTIEFLTKNGIEVDKLEQATKRKFHIEDVPVKPDAGDEAIKKPVGELMQDKPAPAGPDPDEPDAYTLDAQGNIVPELPEKAWEISAVLLKTRSSIYALRIQYDFKSGSNEATAVSPAAEMRQFFDTFLGPSTLVLQVISWLVIVVAAISILVSIYNAISGRMREIAILRALGATRARVLTLICTEAALIGLFGAALGLVVGHLIGAGESVMFSRKMGQSIAWYNVSAAEWYSILVAVAIAAVAGLVPAIKAYSVPVATNLTSG